MTILGHVLFRIFEFLIKTRHLKRIKTFDNGKSRLMVIVKSLKYNYILNTFENTNTSDGIFIILNE